MPGTAFPEDQPNGEEPDLTVTERDIREALDAYAKRQSVANPLGGEQADGGAARDVPARETEPSNLLGSKFNWHDPAEDAVKTPGFISVEPDPNARVQKWADVAMWEAPEHVDPQTPKVTVSMCTPDPLGMMAMVNAQYTGRNLTSPSQVTDEERRQAWDAATVSRLSETPLEWIQWSINFENVSRAFTHQLVRTRMATYAQESQRFAVKDHIGDAVKLPPSLAGTLPWREFADACRAEGVEPDINASQEQKWRWRWDNALARIEQAYGDLVNTGMPAEDARGLLPTNMLTRVHMRVDMKTLLNLAGMRLCTQAQFEWRAVFAALAQAIREYGRVQWSGWRWQFDLIADSFRPVCYAANKCTMKAKTDRACSIRAQVDTFAELGIPSSKWETGPDAGIPPIRPEQWLADPTAARVAPGQEQ